MRRGPTVYLEKATGAVEKRATSHLVVPQGLRAGRDAVLERAISARPSSRTAPRELLPPEGHVRDEDQVAPFCDEPSFRLPDAGVATTG